MPDIKKLRELYRQTGKKKLRIVLGSGKCVCTAIYTEYDDNGDTEFVADCLPDYVLQENVLVAEDHRPFMNYIVAACNALPELLDEVERLRKALHLACVMADNQFDTCPLDMHEWEGCLHDGCQNEMAECCQRYFLEKARGKRDDNLRV